MNKGIKYVIVGLVAAALAVFTIRALKMDTDSVEVSAISEQETIEAAPSKQDTSGVEKTPSVKKDANMTETAQVDLTGLDLENVLFLDVSVGGRVVIETYPDKAPAHVARFKELVRAGFYDGIVFHRV
ncbi:MAG: peptidylprolyl isomerase, partial [Sphingomonadales bacterium]